MASHLNLPSDLAVVFYRETEFNKSLGRLRHGGGTAKQAADQVDTLLGKLYRRERAADLLGKLTHHGENRIKGAFKFDLAGRHRLVCWQSGKVLAMLFVGDHEDTDRWLDSNRGLTIIVDKASKRLTPTREVKFAEPLPLPSVPRSQLAPDALFTKLSADALRHLPLDPADVLRLHHVTGASSDEEILEAVDGIVPAHRDLVLSVFVALRDSDIDGAVAHIQRYRSLGSNAVEAPRLLEQAIESNVNSDVVVVLRELSSYEYELFLKHRSFRDWLLFLHPDQKALVNLDFDGPAAITGVSGSGKTCILLHKAARQAAQHSEARVLLLTLNRALAGLLAGLLGDLCAVEARKRIEVVALYDLCVSIIKHFEPERHLLVHDPRSGETLEDCWVDSFEKPEQQEVLGPVMARLRGRHGFDAQRYVRDEFAWIRSGLRASGDASSTSRAPARDSYLTPELVQRTGRCIPLAEDQRQRVLRGLAFYEEHMEMGGFVDPAAVSLMAHRHIDRLYSDAGLFSYDAVFVDEMQDLGVIELEIVKALARDRGSLTLAGDINQQVYPKRHSLKDAGLHIPPQNRRFMRKNYRNTKQILEVGWALLQAHGEPASAADDGLQLLPPEMASRQGPLPVFVQCNTDFEELEFVSRFVAQHRDSAPDSPVCIAATWIREDDENQLKNLSSRLIDAKLPVRVLSMDKEVRPGEAYVSALETVKGFEFGLVILLRCSASLVPDPDIPQGERWRDARRVYVAMTRARDELVATYRGKPSILLTSLGSSLARWTTAREEGL